MSETRVVDLGGIIDQIDLVHRERRTPGAPYTSDRRFLEFIEYHLPAILAAARDGLRARAAIEDRPDLTEDQTQVIRHALGLDWRSKPYRNGYKAPLGHHSREVCESLVMMGLMTVGSGSVFTVTTAGMEAVKVFVRSSPLPPRRKARSCRSDGPSIKPIGSGAAPAYRGSGPNNTPIGGGA